MSQVLCTQCRKRVSRSPEQHRRYFAFTKAAHQHWPESHEFQPDSADHLRKWLQIKAGYREVVEVDVQGMSPILAATVSEAVMRAAKSYAFCRVHAGKLKVFRSKSIAFAELGSSPFTKLCEAVEAAVEAETGLKPDDLLTVTEAA